MPCFILGSTLFMWCLCLNLQVSMLSMFMAWFTCFMLVYMPISMLVPRFMGPNMSTPGLEKQSREPPPWAFTWPPTMATILSAQGPIRGPSRMMDGCVCACGVVHMGLRVLSLSLFLSQWRKVGLPLMLWQESGPNFIGLPKVSGVATNYWVFLRCDWSPISS